MRSSVVTNQCLFIPKDEFPTDRVYKPTPGAELRLITADADREILSYRDNIVVFAVTEDYK